MGLYFPREEKGEKRYRERARGRREEREGGEYQRRVWTQTALLTGTPKEREDEREKATGKRRSKSENESSRKAKNFPSLTSPLLFPSSSSLSLYSSLSVPSICPCVSSPFSSITSFCPPPHPSSPPSHPSAITLHTFHYLGDQAKRDVWGRSDHYHHLFPLHSEL